MHAFEDCGLSVPLELALELVRDDDLACHRLCVVQECQASFVPRSVEVEPYVRVNEQQLLKLRGHDGWCLTLELRGRLKAGPA